MRWRIGYIDLSNVVGINFVIHRSVNQCVLRTKSDNVGAM